MAKYLPAKSSSKYPKRIKRAKIAAAQMHTLRILQSRAMAGKSVSQSKLETIDIDRIGKAHL